jgi:putative transposase
MRIQLRGSTRPRHTKPLRESGGTSLVCGRRDLLRLLRRYIRHYNQQRPHRGLALAVPQPQEPSSPQVNPREVERRDVLGGLIHEYHEVAA